MVGWNLHIQCRFTRVWIGIHGRNRWHRFTDYRFAFMHWRIFKRRAIWNVHWFIKGVSRKPISHCCISRNNTKRRGWFHGTRVGGWRNNWGDRMRSRCGCWIVAGRTIFWQFTDSSCNGTIHRPRFSGRRNDWIAIMFDGRRHGIVGINIGRCLSFILGGVDRAGPCFNWGRITTIHLWNHRDRRIESFEWYRLWFRKRHHTKRFWIDACDGCDHQRIDRYRVDRFVDV